MEKISNINRQVIHLHIKASDEHHYFGSIAAMYDHYNADELGVAAQSLYNRWKDQVWENDKIILRKSRLIDKKKKK